MELLIFELQDKGLSVRDDFISHQDALLIREFAKQQDHKFKPATVGKNLEVKKEIRGDVILWLDFNEHEILKKLEQTFQKLIQTFNQNFYMGIKEFEGHYALYQTGSFYKKHIDRHQGTTNRQITFLLYLNPDYQTGDGGELVIYDKENPKKVLKTIEPTFGRVVFFISEDYWHEVLPCNKERLSLTGWFRT